MTSVTDRARDLVKDYTRIFLAQSAAHMRNWFPENISTVGGEIDALFYLILFIAGAAALLAHGILAARGRREATRLP